MIKCSSHGKNVFKDSYNHICGFYNAYTKYLTEKANYE